MSSGDGARRLDRLCARRRHSRMGPARGRRGRVIRSPARNLLGYPARRRRRPARVCDSRRCRAHDARNGGYALIVAVKESARVVVVVGARIGVVVVGGELAAVLARARGIAGRRVDVGGATPARVGDRI